MRKIKFRQWCSRNKKFHYWGFLENNAEFFESSLGYMSKDNPRESQQFTGLLDKDGKEIYEGDILSPNNREVLFRTNVKIGSVFDCAGFYTDCHNQNRPEMLGLFTFGKTQAEVSEVIGNIFENPELLKNGEPKKED